MAVYPTNPSEWQVWIEKHLDIDVEKAVMLLESDSFPTEDLEALWQREFTAEKGYVSDFIPALLRNKMGLIRWVYCGYDEPDWRGSD